MAKSRRNKGLVVEFDETKRRDFLSGFRKRKKQRRKAAVIQQQDKERKKRLAARQERRLIRDEALGLKKDQSEESCDVLEEIQDGQNENDKGSVVVYEDDHIKTVVKTCSIEGNDTAEAKVAPIKQKKKVSRNR